VLRNGSTSLVLDWAECGVAMPGSEVPRRRGYGSELIERALPYQLGAKTKLAFEPDGVHCQITVPLNRSGAERNHE
jgi:two-component sensor histidine kinase